LGNLAPLFLMCDAGDIGVHSDPQSPLSEGKPTVIIYDQAPGGIGFSQRLYEIHDEMIGRSLEQVTACDCVEGCPSCVGPAGENSSGGKAETLAILRALVR
jgi:DEAD/DEAH box helicase domain-containing protein